MAGGRVLVSGIAPHQRGDRRASLRGLPIHKLCGLAGIGRVVRVAMAVALQLGFQPNLKLLIVVSKLVETNTVRHSN